MELTLPTHRLSRTLADLILRLTSWRVEVNPPAVPKYVLIGAPHTSNWDFFYFLLMVYASGLKLNFVGKDSLFRWPLGFLMRRLGGIPVDRRANNNFVAQMVEEYNQRDQLVITIAPEGTRGKTDYWRTGFYYIALGAGVPIALGYIDYRHKVVGIGPTISPTGDLHADFVRIREFYAQKTGRYPQLQGEIKLQSGR
jgi:1-acyl-sn-glycerol-3-phosphate acyltransferase